MSLLTTSIVALLAPSRCLACARRGPQPWCESCAGQVRALPDGCRRCSSPGRASHACWPSDAPIEACVAAFDYRGPVAAAVVAAKVGGAHAGWSYLAPLLACRVARAPWDAEVVTWVTTPARRVRRRGIDHAAVLATAVAGALDLPCVRLLDASPSRSGGDGYVARRRLPGTAVLLVDDVLTTGTTAWRAASCLRLAGADLVELAVLARAGMHPLGSARR